MLKPAKGKPNRRLIHWRTSANDTKYQVRITTYAESCVGDIFDYLMLQVGEYGNPGAAKRFADDYEDVLRRLADSAHGFAVCDDAELAILGERKIHFRHLKYVAFFHIHNSDVIIDLVCHVSRNYKTLL